MPAPVNSTYVTKDFPIVTQMDSRTYQNTKDGYWTNFIPSIIKNQITGESELSLEKRTGSTAKTSGNGTGATRGLFYWEDQAKFFLAMGRDVFVYDSTGTLSTTFTNALDTASTPVGFCTFIDGSGVTSVIFTDGLNLHQISTALVDTLCVDAELPVPHLPIPIFMDGYLILVKSNTNDAYNSDLELPMSWTSGNFISAESSSDVVRSIAKVNDYFVLFGSDSIEFFYNAAIATGSPFQRNATFCKLSGFYGGLTSYGNKLYFLANQTGGSVDVMMLDNYTLTNLTTPAIHKKFLVEGGASNTWRGDILSMQGTTLYVMSAGGAALYLDLATGLYGFLTHGSGTTFPFAGIVRTNVAAINGYFIRSDSNIIYQFLTQSGTDVTPSGTQNITATLVTGKTNMGVPHNKFMFSLSVIADRTGSGSNNIDISSTDDDYVTYTTPRSVDMNHERVNLQQWGRFRTRALKITHTGTQSCKLYQLIADLNMGTT